MGYADELFDLTDRVVLVTGGSRGLGREMAFAAAQCGADVVIASRKYESCVATADEIAAATGRAAFPYQVHVGRWDELDGLVDAAYDRFGKVRRADQQRGHVAALRVAGLGHREAVRLGGEPQPQGSVPVVHSRRRTDGGRRRRVDHQRQLQRVTPSPAGAAAVLGGQGGAQRVDGRARPGLRADRAGQHVDARPVPDRRQQGVGHTGDDEGRATLRTPASWQSSRKSSAPHCFWRQTHPATPAGRSSGPTVGCPSRYGSTMLKPGSGRSTTASTDGMRWRPR